MTIPFRTSRFEWIAGAFLLFTMLAALIALFLVMRAGGYLERRSEYHVVLSEAFGVTPGAPVRVLGLDAGRVETVELTDDNRIRVRFSVRQQLADRIRQDAVASLGGSMTLTTVLGGTGLVVNPGSPEAPLLPSGSELPAEPPASIAELLPGFSDDPLFADARQIARNLRTVTDRVAADDSAWIALLADGASVLAKVNRDDNTVGRLLADNGKMYDRVDGILSNLERATGRIEPILVRVDSLMKRADASLAAIESMSGSGARLVDAMNPVVAEAGTAMRNLNAAVKLFAATTKDLSGLVRAMNEIVVQLDKTVRATQKIFPIRRHLDQPD